MVPRTMMLDGFGDDLKDMKAAGLDASSSSDVPHTTPALSWGGALNEAAATSGASTGGEAIEEVGSGALLTSAAFNIYPRRRTVKGQKADSVPATAGVLGRTYKVRGTQPGQGLVYVRDRRMYTRETNGGVLDVEATYLSNVHKRMDVTVDKQGQTYRHTPAAGTRPNDVTAFVPEHASWGEDRHDGRPAALFMYQRIEPAPRFSNVGWLRDEFGRICLCPDNHPIKDHVGMPLTVSAKIEAWMVAAIIRENTSIGMEDFRARMPPGERPTAHWISEKVSRMRQKFRILAIDRKAYDDETNFWTVALHHDMARFPQYARQNTTFPLEDYTDFDYQYFKEKTYGCSLFKAGNRRGAPPDDQRLEAMEQNLRDVLGDDHKDDTILVKHIRHSIAFLRRKMGLSFEAAALTDEELALPPGVVAPFVLPRKSRVGRVAGQTALPGTSGDRATYSRAPGTRASRHSVQPQAVTSAANMRTRSNNVVHLRDASSPPSEQTSHAQQDASFAASREESNAVLGSASRKRQAEDASHRGPRKHVRLNNALPTSRSNAVSSPQGSLLPFSPEYLQALEEYEPLIDEVDIPLEASNSSIPSRSSSQDPREQLASLRARNAAIEDEYERLMRNV